MGSARRRSSTSSSNSSSVTSNGCGFASNIAAVSMSVFSVFVHFTCTTTTISSSSSNYSSSSKHGSRDTPATSDGRLKRVAEFECATCTAHLPLNTGRVVSVRSAPVRCVWTLRSVTLTVDSCIYSIYIYNSSSTLVSVTRQRRAVLQFSSYVREIEYGAVRW